MEGKRVATMLPKKLLERLEAAAKEDLSNKCVMIRQAIGFFLDSRDRKCKSEGKKQ